ncbi:MAG: hypothetical protein NC485_14800 [Ruminococcus flavefaciens]|nr:hypothetical protein [Ruminococcus flavefaciens]MCM1062433.1 hypothetical protein [Eubacterium sp.]
MQGNGTQNDPYIPESWDEFVQAVGTYDAYVTMPESGGIFDMKKIAPKGGITVDIKCKLIEGNNWEIRNAYNCLFSVDDIAAQNGVSIVGLHFLNFYIDKYESIYGYSLIWANSLLLLGCKFSGTVASDVGYPVLLYLRSGTVATCSFNVKLSGKAIFSDNSTYVIYFNYTNVIIDNSDYVGSISCPLYVTSADSFFEHIANANGIKIYLSPDKNSKSSIVHSNAGSSVATLTETYVKVTEDQLKDVEYLRSIRFPIVRGEQE